MFDLFRSREKSVRILLGALLLLVALSMLTYLVPNYGSGDGSASDVVVAEIGKDPITIVDVQRTIQATMKGRQIPPEVLGTLVPEMVEGMINERALAYEAERLGYQVTDADIAQAIQAMIPNLFQDGKFVGKETYAAMLAQQNLTIAEFERELKRSMMISRLRQLARESVVISPQEIEQEFRRRNEKAKVEYVKVVGDKYKSEVNPTETEMRQLFQGTQARYQMPEKKSLVILLADQAKLEQTVQPSDADLLRSYNQNKDSYRTPERVKVRHILLKTTDKPAAEEPKIRARAEDLLKQIKAGGNFSELAKKNSEDTGSAQTGGELPDWVTRGQTVPEFEKVAFTLNPGQTSDLVKTQYGYHIIQVLQKEPARLRPFEEVKGEIAAQWKKQRVADLMDQATSRAQSMLQKDPGNPEKVAAELNLQLVRAAGVAPGDPLPEVGVNKDFEESISTLKKGEVSQPVALPGNKVALALIADVMPTRPQTFEEAKAAVRAQIVNEKLSGITAARAEELAQKARSMNGDLKAAAKSMGLEVKASDSFTRQGAVEGLGSASYVPDAFTKPAGTIVGPLGIPEGRVVVKVISQSAADMSQFLAQRSGIRDELKSNRARERSSLFEAGLRESLVKQGKIKIHQDVISRLTANYRG
jgi:peptidyl-prolyl cis-trans isomerase D